MKQLNVKIKWSRIAFVGLLIVSIGLNYSCNKECDEKEIITPSDEYYVKYEVNSATIYYGGKLDVTINSDDNSTSIFIIDQRKLWETIIGPVKKGFNASIIVKSKSVTNDKLELNTKIYVSKNGSPFALKESDCSDIPRNSVQINYKIDY